MDSAVTEKELSIRGWYYWKGDWWTRRCKAYVILKGEDGECAYYAAYRQEREDVRKALNIKTADCGFVSRIPCGEMAPENSRYQIGVLIEIPLLGMRKLVWCGEITNNCS